MAGVRLDGVSFGPWPSAILALSRLPTAGRRLGRGYAWPMSDRAFARPGSEAPWQPSAADLADSRLARFVRRGGRRRGRTDDRDALERLQARAVADRAGSGARRPTTSAIAWQRRPATTLDLVRARLGRAGGSAARSTTRSRPRSLGGRPTRDAALAWEGEDGRSGYTGPSSTRRSGRPPGTWRSSASGEGIRVGILLPMLAETAIAVLALGRLRAIFTPIFSGYAAPAVAARLDAFAATHLITADGFSARGVVPLKAVADEAVARGAVGPDGRGRPPAAAGRSST